MGVNLSKLIVNKQYDKIEKHIEANKYHDDKYYGFKISKKLYDNPKSNNTTDDRWQCTSIENFLTFAVKRNDTQLVKILLKYTKTKVEHFNLAYDNRNYEIITLIIKKSSYEITLSKEMAEDRQLIYILLPYRINNLLNCAIKYNKILALEIINDDYKLDIKNAFDQAIKCDDIDIMTALLNRYKSEIVSDIEYYKTAIKYKSKNMIKLLKINHNILNEAMLEAVKKCDIDKIQFLIDAGCEYNYIGIELSRHAHNNEAYMLIKKLIKENKIDITSCNDVDETMKTIAYKNNDLRLMTLLRSVENNTCVDFNTSVDQINLMSFD